MSTIKMSVNKALKELKLYTAKIERKIGQGNFVGFEQEGRIPNSNVTVKEFKEQGEAAFQSVKDLIANRNAIKSAVVKSNAKTIVTVDGKEMTVAEAIERKDSISFDKTLLHSLRIQRNAAQSKVERINVQLEADADRSISNMTQNMTKETKDNLDLDSIRKTFKVREATLLEGIKDLDKTIEDLEETIEGFEADVDISINESNVKTEIEVELA